MIEAAAGRIHLVYACGDEPTRGPDGMKPSARAEIFDYGVKNVVMLCAGSELVNPPPDTPTADKVARSWLLEVRQQFSEVGIVPPEIVKAWLTVDVLLLIATIAILLPDLNAATYTPELGLYVPFTRTQPGRTTRANCAINLSPCCL